MFHIFRIHVQEMQEKILSYFFFYKKYSYNLYEVSHWICFRLSCGYSYYAIAFGVDQLSGSLYLNMFLLSIIEIPSSLITWFLANRFVILIIKDYGIVKEIELLSKWLVSILINIYRFSRYALEHLAFTCE